MGHSMSSRKEGARMGIEVKYELSMVLGVLEDCFGRIPLTMPEVLNRVSEEDIKFYYKHFKRLEVIRDGRNN